MVGKICFKIFIIIWCIIQNSSLAWCDDSTKVLLLNSYNQGYNWTDVITASIQAEFEKMESIVQLSIEYMETKNYHSAEYSERLRKLYEYK